MPVRRARGRASTIATARPRRSCARRCMDDGSARTDLDRPTTGRDQAYDAVLAAFVQRVRRRAGARRRRRARSRGCCRRSRRSAGSGCCSSSAGAGSARGTAATVPAAARTRRREPRRCGGDRRRVRRQARRRARGHRRRADGGPGGPNEAHPVAMRWMRVSALLAVVLLIGWVFILWQNQFHVTRAGGVRVPRVPRGRDRRSTTCGAPARRRSRRRRGRRRRGWGRPIGARGELEKEKRTLLKAIKEAEFDLAMGKLSKADADEMIAHVPRARDRGDQGARAAGRRAGAVGARADRARGQGAARARGQDRPRSAKSKRQEAEIAKADKDDEDGAGEADDRDRGREPQTDDRAMTEAVKAEEPKAAPAAGHGNRGRSGRRRPRRQQRRDDTVVALAIALAAAAASPAHAQIAGAIGKPLPSPDLPAARSACASSPAGRQARSSAPTSRSSSTARRASARTDAAGRAIFPDLPAGATVQAKVLDDDKKEVTSDAFQLSDDSGARLMLVDQAVRTARRRRRRAVRGWRGGAMPEPRQMSGQPRPEQNDPPGTSRCGSRTTTSRTSPPVDVAGHARRLHARTTRSTRQGRSRPTRTAARRSTNLDRTGAHRRTSR